MRKIENVVYKFNELKQDVKEKIINDVRECLIEDNFKIFRDNVKKTIQQEELLILNDFYYSLSYQQGDGFCFTASNILNLFVLINANIEEMNPFEKFCKDFLTDKEMEKLLAYLKNGYNLKITYVSDNLSKIDYDYPYYFDDEESMNDLIFTISKKLNIVYKDICKKYEDIGYTCYDVSDEECIEIIEDQNNEYYENGEMYEE